MEKYESKQVRILRPASSIYEVLSRFDHLSPVLADKVEEWQATEDRCSFKAKGFPIALRMVEREPYKLIKVAGEEGSPMNFTLWVQLASVSEEDTRMRLVLHVELNMMMKMMIGGKLAQAMDQIAEQVAEAFNRAPR
ncbi:MAG: polyketide cyclase [Alistipes sp.]|nr:polyketide cyclase [Alistipes sp.]